MPHPRRSSWFTVRSELSPRRRALLYVGAFLLPLVVWSLISYVPWIWHPLMQVSDPGASTFLTAGMTIERQAFADENAKLVADGKAVASGVRVNPIAPRSLTD